MRNISLLAVSTLLASTAFGVSGQAASIAVTNPSFEADPVNCCGANATITGWQFADGSSATGTQNQSPNNPVGTDGVQWAFLNIDGASAAPNENGTITSTVSPTIIAPNTLYTLTVALGNNNEVNTNYNFPGDDQIRLLANNTTIAASPLISGYTIPNDTFVDYTVTYQSGANSTVDPNVGQPLNIQLYAQQRSDASCCGQSLFDNVRLDGTTVPEPAALSLFGLAGFGLLARRRRIA